MSLRLRTLFLLLASTALIAAGCGGSDGEATSDTDVNKLLEQTFTGEKKVDSGKLDFRIAIDAQGGQQSGPIDVKVGGPFQSQGAQKIPKFDMDFDFTGAGQSVKGGVLSTGDKGFATFNGQDYAVSDQVFRQLRAGYEEAQKQSEQQNKGKQPSLASLGIDPRKWLTNPKNAGEEKVGDADTIRITGGVDVNKLLDDLNTALGKARSLGLQNSGQLPQSLTPEQRKQVTDAVKDLQVQIFTGKEDKILRRMVIDVAVEPGQTSANGPQSAKVKVDFSLLELNQDQEFKAPANAKPADELLGQLGGLGGALGGASGGSGSGSSGSGSGGAANQEQLDKYTQCITDAGSDTAKAQECAKLLQG